MKIWITTETHSLFQQTVNEGACLACICPSDESFAVLVDHWDTETLQQFSDKVAQLAAKGKSFGLKIVGNISLAPVQIWSKQAQLQITKIVEVKSAFEIQFHPKEGRLRLARLATPARKTPIKIVLIDDSKTIRSLLTQIFSGDPELQVVGECADPRDADQLIEKLRPDVVTLDIHMPEMDGVTLLKQLLPKYKLPFVMVTAVSLEEGPLVLQALEVGAVDYVQKPASIDIASVGQLIREKVKAAVLAQVHYRAPAQTPAQTVPSPRLGPLDTSRVVAIGSSTGGVEALRQILTALPAETPPILITQHIPALFSKSFAERMNSLCAFPVSEAKDGDAVKPGHAYIAPGGLQMSVVKKGGQLIIAITDDPPVNRHKPSVDVLFQSVAAQVGSRAIGVILTGMGDDGARGLLKMREMGCLTLAQNEESCVVFGMPRAAIKLEAAQHVVGLDQIAGFLERTLQKSRTA